MVECPISNKKKLIYILIKEFKNKSAALNKILSCNKKIYKIINLYLQKEEHAIDEIYELKTERDEEMELLKKELKILALRERYFGNFDKFENYKEEIKLETSYLCCATK